MKRRIATYLAAFLVAFMVWFCLMVIKGAFPFLPWQYPFLAVFMGMTFPGGATPELHYVNHVAGTWFPFLVAFLIARALTRRRAKFLGGLVLYAVFLGWSWVMVLLDQQAVPINIIFNIGLLGTFFGGAGLYLWIIDPVRPRAGTST